MNHKSKNERQGNSIPTEAKKEFDKTFQCFKEGNSIPGVSQMFQRKRLLSKIFWVFLIVFAVGLFCYQAVVILQDYFKYDIRIRSQLRLEENELSFPSVTLCSNQPMDWSLSKQTFASFEDELNVVAVNKTKYEKKILGHKLLMEKLLEMTEEERLAIGYQKEDFIIHCEFNGKPCNDSNFIVFNNLFFGNCFTFNPGFESRITGIDTQTYLQLTLKDPLERHCPYFQNFASVLINVHSPATTPVFKKRRANFARIGAWNIFEIHEFRFQRLAAPYTSKCVNATDLELRKKSLFYSNKLPYLYSTDACLATCRRNGIRRSANCTPPEYVTFGNNSDHLALCEKDFDFLTFGDCDCPFLCTETIYKMTSRIEDGEWWLKDLSNQMLLFEYMNESDSEDLDGVSERFKANYSSIVFNFECALHQFQEELAAYTVSDLWGTIGGNLGLIIGVSLLSIMEIFELGFVYVVMKLMCYWNRLTGNDRQASSSKVNDISTQEKCTGDDIS